MGNKLETKGPSGGLRLGERAPADLVDARLQLHWAVQLVSAVGDTLLPAAADDSHTSLEWLEAPSLLAGRLTADPSPCRAALRPADLRLVVLGERDGAVAELALNGTTITQAMVWLEQEISACRRRPLPRPLRRRELDLPDHGVGRGARFNGSDAGAFAELARWYAVADSVLRRVALRTTGAAPVRCWPHHFDIATLVTLERGRGAEDARSIGIGMSPGDASYPEPYWYVTPWPRPDEPRLPMLAGDGEWHRDGWMGAVLTGSTIATESSAEAQAERVEFFLGSALAACRELLRA